MSLKDAKVEKRSGGIFLGDVEVTTLIDESIGSKEYRVAIVTFSPNARNKWHVHDHDQLLYVLKGKGIVATEKEERLVTVGDTILIPAGEKHWHGATEDSIFSHLYVMKVGTKTSF
ncbi:MAG: cupin domain-containing protein [Nitrososphaerota archaeon]|nr:cupin domain-containing protein [Nitrososphaerales archaeon]MDW8045267.1 cupin domain-containing protein [Nitrososphaerota archaeon]